MADFGLARSFETHMSDVEKTFFTEEEAKGLIEDCCELTQLGCGTEYYIAPEVFRNEAYSYAVDVWAVGVIVYQLLFGRVSSISLSYNVSYLVYFVSAAPLGNFGLETQK